MTTTEAGGRLTVADWSLLRARLVWGYAGRVARDNLAHDSGGGALFAWRLRRGEVRVRSGRRSLRARAGEWVLAGPGPHRQEFSHGAEIVSVKFRLEWPTGESLVEPWLVVTDAGTRRLNRAAERLVAEIGRCFPGAGVDLWTRTVGEAEFFGIEARFAEWAGAYLEVLREHGARPARLAGMDARVTELARLLDRLPWGERYVEEEVAARLGLSGRHLERLFVRGLGMRPREYLKRRRVEEAKRALADRAVPVKQVGFALGFATAAHFCRWFKAETGARPGEARAGRGA